MDPALDLDRTADLLIEDGRIAAVGSGLPSRSATVRSGEGLIAFPGFLDLHAHLRDPGRTDKETLASGLLAAAHGGFVAVLAMANTEPPVDRPEQVVHLIHRAASLRGAALFPAAAATRGQRGLRPTAAAALARAGAVALSDDGRYVARADVMREVLRRAAAARLPVLSHAEEERLSRGGVAGEGPTARRLGLPVRPALAERLAVERELALAEDTGAALHLCHLSTAAAVARLAEAKGRGLPVTGEATPHHLLLTEEAVARWGALARVNPPLRGEEDRQALWRAVRDGTVDALATDHAPHTAAEKALPITHAPPGISGLETAVSLIWQEVRAGRLSLERFVSLWCYGPWRILGRTAPSLKEGEQVAITLFDPERTWQPAASRLHTRAPHSPFADWTLVGQPRGILRAFGEVVP